MIDRAAYEAMEQAILSGQVPAEDVPALMTNNPAFAVWYASRAAMREAAAHTTDRRS